MNEYLVYMLVYMFKTTECHKYLTFIFFRVLIFTAFNRMVALEPFTADLDLMLQAMVSLVLSNLQRKYEFRQNGDATCYIPPPDELY